MGEIKSDYFGTGNNGGEIDYYQVKKSDLRDSFNMRRRLVNLFKPTYMGEDGNINFNHWLALPEKGYCFAPSPPRSGARGMVMDVISRDGFIRGIVVGVTRSCAGAKVDKDFKARFPRTKASSYSGGGC